MSMRIRLLLASLCAGVWFGIVTPRLMDQIEQQRSLGVEPVSVEEIQERLDEDTGDPAAEIVDMIHMLTQLKAKEDARMTAMLSLPSQDAITKAKAGMGDLPPPRYMVDHRFFEPLVPELAAMLIETYGYAVDPLAALAGPPTEGERSDHLGILLSLAHHKLLSDEHAAQILQGALELNAILAERMDLEIALREAMDEKGLSL